MVCQDFEPKSFEQVQGNWKEKAYNFFQVYTFLMEKHWTFLLRIQFAFDLRVSHKLDSRKCIIPVYAAYLVLENDEN